MQIGPLGTGIELAVPYENQGGEVAGVCNPLTLLTQWRANILLLSAGHIEPQFVL